MHTRTFAFRPTLIFEELPWLRGVSEALIPDALITASTRSWQGMANKGLYVLLVLGLVALWIGALWLTRPGARAVGLRWILAPVLLFCLPLVLLPSLISNDVYAYMFYGRQITEYGRNPLLVTPMDFPTDPHLRWVMPLWRDVPSVYGPVFLAYCAALSAVAGDSMFANLLTYKVAAMVLHLLTTVVIWAALRKTRSELAAWGAVFYGWNPFVLFEIVGNVHSEVLLTPFLCLSLLMVAHRRWLLAVFFLTAATMVKLQVVLLLPLLVLAWMRILPDTRARIQAMGSAAAVSVASMLLLYLPFWAHTTLFVNVLEVARTYRINTVWGLLVAKLATRNDPASVAALHSTFDLVRNCGFLLAYLICVWMLVKGRELTDMWAWMWFALCLSLAWIWPWYLLLSIPAAAIRGPSRSAVLAVGITLGGMLFWFLWPKAALHPAFQWTYEYRSFLLFAPAILMALWPGLSWRVERLLGRTVA